MYNKQPRAVALGWELVTWACFLVLFEHRSMCRSQLLAFLLLPFLKNFDSLFCHMKMSVFQLFCLYTPHLSFIQKNCSFSKLEKKMCLQIFIQDSILLAVNSQRVQIFLGRRKNVQRNLGKSQKHFVSFTIIIKSTSLDLVLIENILSLQVKFK